MNAHPIPPEDRLEDRSTARSIVRSLRGRIATLAKREPRILALLVFHNEMRYLPGYIQNVAPQVDGIVALDDGSTDGSTEFMAAQPAVLKLIVNPPQVPHVWDERLTHAQVIRAALDDDPDWLIAIDADERLEQDFRARALAEIRRARQRHIRAYFIKLYELWGSPTTYRIDGLWGHRYRARFFEARHDYQINSSRFHGSWAPVNSQTNGTFPKADLILYHLKMIHALDRERRQARYQQLDPDHQWQSIGYDYLTDEAGLQLASLPLGRAYLPLAE